MNYVENIEHSKADYQKVASNIYKVGKRYRVRVSGKSANASSKKEAIRLRKLMKDSAKSAPIW